MACWKRGDARRQPRLASARTLQVANDVARYAKQPRERIALRNVVDSSPRHEERLRDDFLGVMGWHSTLCVSQDSVSIPLVEGFDEVSRLLIQRSLSLGRPTTSYVRHRRPCFTCSDLFAHFSRPRRLRGLSSFP